MVMNIMNVLCIQTGNSHDIVYTVPMAFSGQLFLSQCT